MKTFPVFRKKEETFFYKLRHYLREYANASNIHGVRYLSEKRSRAEKLFWIIALFLSLSVCIVIICGVWERYKNSPIVISFASTTVPVYEIPFPAVTICPVTKCTSSKLNYTAAALELYFGRNVSEEERRFFNYVDLLCNVDEYLVPDETFDDDFFKGLDEVKPYFDFNCTFLDRTCRCEQYFTPVITGQGICYSFNTGDKEHIFRDNVAFLKPFYEVKYDFNETDERCRFVKNEQIDTYPLKAISSGYDNALKVALRYDRLDNDIVCNDVFEGYVVLVHNPFDVPRPSKQFVYIAGRKIITLSVEPELVRISPAAKKVHPDIRKCYLTHERPLRYFKQYTQSNCNLECLTNYTLKNCGCVEFYMPREKDTPICAQKRSNCSETAEDELKIEELRNKLSGSKETLCDCKPSCTELTYSIETTYLDYSIDYPPDYEDTEIASILIVCFRKEQFMPVEREVLRGISHLLSEFGGLLGLFTGFSLMSLVEIIYFSTIRIFYNKRLYNNYWSSDSIC